MDVLEGAALLGFVAMLAWIVIEIAWRDPGAAEEIMRDSEGFARQEPPPATKAVLDFAAEPSATPANAPAAPGHEIPPLERAS